MTAPVKTRSTRRDVGLARRLTAFTRQVAGDADFRQALAMQPATALAGAGLDVVSTCGSLTVPAGRDALAVSVELLYGPELAQTETVLELPLEVRLVQYALRPMALVHCPMRTALQVCAIAADRGMHAVLSPWQFRPVYDTKSNSYVNTTTEIRLGDGDMSTWRGVLVSADVRYVEVGWLGLYYGWDILIGLVLGYPACCIAAFPQRWETALADFGGEVGDVLVRDYITEAPIVISHPAANVFARHFGYHIIEHFPCNFECPETARLGADLLAGLEFFEPQTARDLVRVLAAPVYRHHAGETFLFPDGRLDARGILTYHELWASDPTSPVSQNVAAATTLTPNPDGWLLHSGMVD
jgi:hypothetical protein